MDVLQHKWLTQGDKTAAFEKQFASFLGADSGCCAVASCTAALHMALLLGNIGPGDEVILPGLTFVADLNVVWMTGATPVLADARSLDDWNISADRIAAKITPRTRAVIIVHFAGYPCDLDDIIALCQHHNLLLIEDAAHAIGATYQGKKCGTWGDFGCFSFFSNKNMAVGEGGMLAIRDTHLLEKARLMRSHGMTHSTIDRHRGMVESYDVALPGLNYRIDEMRAALGLVQLSKLEWMNTQRRKRVRAYQEMLAAIPEIRIPWNHLSEHKTSSFHIFPVLLPAGSDRPSFMAFMKEHGIQTSIHYPSFKEFSFYRDKISANLPIASEISHRTVTLPLYPDLAIDKILYVCKHITEFFSNTKEQTT